MWETDSVKDHSGLPAHLARVELCYPGVQGQELLQGGLSVGGNYALSAMSIYHPTSAIPLFACQIRLLSSTQGRFQRMRGAQLDITSGLGEQEEDFKGDAERDRVPSYTARAPCCPCGNETNHFCLCSPPPPPAPAPLELRSYFVALARPEFTM